mgnify:CR=1 FL=1
MVRVWKHDDLAVLNLFTKSFDVTCLIRPNVGLDPVFHRGGLFYFGDGHALQGDGEVCGSGLETSMEVTLRFDLLKCQRIQWPRFEDADHIMVAGSARPLSDAMRISFVQLITGWSPTTASQNPTPTS